MELDKDNISDLWDKLTPKLYGYLLHTLRDPALADDILQSTWLKAMENLQLFEERGSSFSAWLFGIARNEMRMHWRKKGREVPYDPFMHDIKEENTELEDKIFIGEIISRLSGEDQELLRLRFIADLAFSDMAVLLRLNPVTVRVKTHRALSRARSMLNVKLYE